MAELALFLGASVASSLLTAVVRHLAIRHALLDVPNARSSHTTPTPRGGGLAIAAITLTAVAAAWWVGWIDRDAAVGLLGGGLVIAATGWTDDLRSLPNGVRAVTQAGAAAWFLWWAGGMETLIVGEQTIRLGFAGNALALVAIVWSTNLYNFMDGIDGLAGGQAVVAGAVAAALLASPLPGLARLSATIAGASFGFLAWNWAPARIFMGDVGSGLLGFLFAALALLSERGGGPPVLVWALLGGVFLFDATVTLLRRAARGERWYAAHRNHAYQRLVQSGWSHAQAAGVALLMTIVLCGLGTLTVRRPDLLAPAGGLGLLVLTSAYLWIERRRPM